MCFSEITFCDIAIDVMSIGLMGASCFLDNSGDKTISFISGLGIMAADICTIVLRKPQQYLSDTSVVEAYKRAKRKAWSAEFESEWRTIGK